MVIATIVFIRKFSQTTGSSPEFTTNTMKIPLSNRRQFLYSLGSVCAVSIAKRQCTADGRPPVTHPRATDGDERFEPNWDERIKITVGHEKTKSANKADLVGSDDKVLQAALDYISRMGGGSVHILPGTYLLRNSVHLPSKVRLVGSGEDTILTKIPSETAELSSDSDWYDQEVNLKKTLGFQVGDGVALQAKNPHHGGQVVIKRTLTARSGNRFKLSDGLRENLWLTGKPTCSSLFPLLTSERTSDVIVENLTLDGNGKNNENFNGNYGGCAFLQDCNRYTFRNVTARNYNGDGISFQICHDVVVENCYCHDNHDLGIHPGSGSQRPLILGNRLNNNSQGIFWCWGVKYGLAENNSIDGNRRYGISIGHCDTDNLIRNNKITNSGEIGILFRDDPRGEDFWANRNSLVGNTIENSGGENGVAIDITGKTKAIKIIGNTLRESREKKNRSGIRIGNEVGRIILKENIFEGLKTDVIDARSSEFRT